MYFMALCVSPAGLLSTATRAVTASPCVSVHQATPVAAVRGELAVLDMCWTWKVALGGGGAVLVTPDPSVSLWRGVGSQHVELGVGLAVCFSVGGMGEAKTNAAHPRV